MSLKQILFYGVLCLALYSCNEVQEAPEAQVLDFSSLEQSQKVELAEWYKDVSYLYLQPSYLRRAYLDSAAMVLPNEVDYVERPSYSYKKVGDHIKAMELLNKAVTMDTAQGSSATLEYRAWTYLYFYRDYEGAINDVELIEKMTGRPYNSCWGEPCGYQKGQALYKLKRYNEAIDAFKLVNIEEEKKGFSTDSNNMIFFYIGRCFAEMNDYDNAILYYKKSLKAADKLPETYYQLGMVYKELGNNSLAQENFIIAREYLDYTMQEPYIERFDEVFAYMIDAELDNPHIKKP